MSPGRLAALARFIARRPAPIAGAGLALSFLSAFLAARMPVKTGLLDAFPAGKASIAAFTDFTRDFGMLDGLVIVLQVPTPAPERLIAAADAVGEKLDASPLFSSVDYNAVRSSSRLMTERFPAWLDAAGVAQLDRRLTHEGIRRQTARNREALLSPFGSPADAELIARDPLGLRDIVRDSLMRRPVPKGVDLSTGYYMDAGRTTALVMARPRGLATDLAFGGTMIREISRIVAEARRETGDPSWTAGVTGGYARAAEAASAIWRDMVVSFVASFVLVMAAIGLAYRPSVAILVVFSAALFCALSWTLALAYLLYGSLNVVTSVVTALLIGMYVDYLIQIYVRFEETFRESGDVAGALETTMTGMGKAVVTGSLTTSVSFFSIVVTSFRGLHELGVVAGFGVLLCLVASLAFAPALLVILARSRPGMIRARRPAGIGVGWAARLAESHGRVLRALFAGACLAAAVAAAFVRFETDLEALGLRDSAVQQVQRTVERRFGRPGEPLFVVARAPDAERLSADFDAVERLGDALRAAGEVGSFSSPGLLLPPPSAQESALRALAARGLPHRWEGARLAEALRRASREEGMRADPSVDGYARGVGLALAQTAVVTLDDLARSGDGRLSYFYNPERRAIAADLTSPGPSWRPATLSRLKEAVRDAGPDFTLIGPRVIMDEIRSRILMESGLAIVLSFLANVAIVGLHFRSWRRVVRVMLPVTAGTLLTVGAVEISGVGFNFFNIAAIAVISGFGVDYGIYLMQAHLEAAGCGGAEAVRRVGGRTGLCALTTVISCGSLVTTQYRGLASIGTVLCFGALFCFLAAVLLLPATMAPENPAAAKGAR